MRRIAPLLAVALAGCSGGDRTAPAETVLAPKPDGKVTGELEVAAFKGGYGLDFYEKSAKEFEANNPGLKIRVWGDPRVWDQLKTRFVGGDPPDLLFPGWGMDHWALAEEGQLMDLTEALKSPAEEGEGTWGDSFEPSLLELGRLDGKQYVLPLYVMLYGWWYDPAVFAKHGWTPPKTYAELLALGPKIKAAGMAPLTYQGKYPYYMVAGMLLPWAYSIGGPDAVKNAQNLEPGAWKSPAMLQAVKMIRELQDKGFFQEGATAMSHTEAQQEFLNGKAAMVPCGTWLYSEMKNIMRPGAKMAFFLPPVVSGGKGDPTALLIGIEPWMVSSKGKNPQAAVAFYRYMTSRTKAKQFVQEKGTLMAIKGSAEGDVPEVLREPAKAFAASKDVYAAQFRHWYPAFHTEIENALTAFLNKELTPEGFCERVEKAAEATRQDTSIKKHRL